MTKKEYTAPRLSIVAVEAEQMMAASILNPDKDSQGVTLSDEEYDGEFNAKENNVDW